MMEDEVVIARASSGLALRGTYVGGASEMIGTKRALKELLLPPVACKFKAPDRPYKMESLVFSTIQASEDFSNAVHKSGWSVAVNASTGNFFSIGVTASVEGGESKEKEIKNTYARKTSEACYLQCWYIPKATFNLPRNQIQLTEEALDDMRRIRTLNEAKSFLHDYNSHISTGTYYLGGILLKGVTMKSNSETSFASMLDKVITKANAKAEVSYLAAKGGMEFVYLDDVRSSSSTTSSKQQAIVQAVYWALGPSTDDEEEFKKGLEDRSTWYIIDTSYTSDRGELVPVWEIPSVKGVEDLREACNLLQSAWQIIYEIGRLFEMLQNSYRAYQPAKTRPEPNRQLELCLNEGMTPFDIHKNLRNLWVEVSKRTDSDMYNLWTDRLWLFRNPHFQNLLSWIAESTDRDFSDAKALIVKGILTTDMRKALKDAAICLTASIQNLIDQTEEVIDRLPIFEHLSPTQLLERLKALLTAAYDSNTLIQVEAAVKACLCDDSAGSKVVKNIVMQHGFDESGNFGYSVDGDEVLMIIRDLGDAFATPTPGPLTCIPRQQELVPTFCQTDILDITVPTYNSSPRNEYTYSGGFLVDRPNMASCEDPCTRMIDCIRHRIEPFKEILDTNENDSKENDDDIATIFGSDTSNCIDEGVVEIDTVSSNHSLKHSPLEILVRLLVRSDILAQISIFQVLLEERFAIPVLVPIDKDVPTTQGSTEFGHLVGALSFVKVKLANQEILSIAEDTKLLRVVFVSNREVVSQRQITEMAQDVMNCQFPNYRCNIGSSHDPIVMELGVGFILNQAADASNDKSEKHIPCLVFCVSGDHNELKDVLAKIADIVVMETEPDAKPSIPSWTTRQITLSWSTDSRRKDDKIIGKGFVQVWGSFSYVSQVISEYLVKLSLELRKIRDGGAKTLEECFKSVASLNGKTSISNAVVELDTNCFETARISFLLQKSYCEEAQYYFDSLKNQAKKSKLDGQMKICKGTRAKKAKGISQMPILRLFVALLSESDSVKRIIGIWHLQLTIDKKLHSTLQKAAWKENDAFDNYQKNHGSKDMKDNYYRAKEEHVDQMLGLEHLWRELSHIFVADPEHKRQYPQLAALHLMDGFPLEILDGDAGTFHEPWVNTVLLELVSALRKIIKREPKVFVLSVVGLQSSGKSTLLNVMFGAKLKASAGMCTRGVFLQLVKSEWPESDFDYVLILDTMGLKAPEYFGREGVVAQDNRIATFAVLPADACVVMVANEEDNGLKEVLPMVMLAFKGSALAEKASGRLRAKLFFVYRSVDQSDIKKLKNNQRKLTVDLQDASRAVGKLNISGTSDQNSALSDGVSPLHDFQINSEDDKHSDVKYFGNLKKDTTPPDDVPIWEYGSKVEELREYIHRRVLNGGRWKAHELVKWTEHLGMVWRTIGDANFELSFVNQMEYANFNDLHTKLGTCRQKVGKKWQDEFESLTGREELTQATQTEQPLSLWSKLWKALESQVEDTVKNVEEEVREILEVELYQNWKVEETNGWSRFCKEVESQWKERLRNWTDGKLGFENLLREYTTKMELEISYVRDKGYNLDKDKDVMKKDFESIFLRVLQDAANKHPKSAEQVKVLIHNKYVRDTVVGEKYNFEAGHSSEDKSILLNRRGHLDTFGWKSVAKWIRPDEKTTPEEILREKLITRLESCLKETKQYSDHLVDDMMQFTEKLSGSSKTLGQSMHNLVKTLLTDELTKIQEKWDKDHNVSKKLEMQRDYFWERFENHARKENDTKMLTMAFCNALRPDYLKAAFTSLLTRMVSSKLLSEQWVCNWKVMRAYLDLHLIELIESNDKRGVVKYVSNGKAHYTAITNKLIKQEIASQLRFKQNPWTLLIERIRDAMSVGAVAVSPGQEKPQMFQETIIKSLNPLSPELAKSVSINVSKDVCRLYGNSINFYEVRDQVLKYTDIQMDTDSLNMDDIVNRVRERMADSSTDSARPRCDAMCPRCGLTCFSALNHCGKHDTLHQPSGLSGVRDKTSLELSPFTCSESVKFDYLMEGPGLPGLVPYKDFEKYFPEWTLPSEAMGMAEVQEYVFAHFQKELVEKHHGTKACIHIPHGFHRNLKDLRLKLSNQIQTYTGQSYNPL